MSWMAVTNILRQGDELIAANNLYGGTFTQFDAILPQQGITTHFTAVNDFEAVEKVLYSGSCILGTVHAENMDELEKKSVLRRWKKDMVFERLVRLGKKEDRERYFEIFDGSGNRLC